MCGRFTLTWPSAPELARLLGVEPSEAFSLLYRPRWNVAPTDPHWVVRLSPGGGLEGEGGPRELAQARWGFTPAPSPTGARRGPLINARSESPRMPGIRDALAAPSAGRGRCIVPVDGFYEWVGEAKAKRPIWFSAPNRDLLRFAGLWQTEPDSQGADVVRFTFFTTAANDVVAAVHDRMPVILAPSDEETWLAGDLPDVLPLLRAAPPGTLAARAVVARANSVKNDDPSCLDPWDPTLEIDLRSAVERPPGPEPKRAPRRAKSKNATLGLPFVGRELSESPPQDAGFRTAPARKSR